MESQLTAIQSDPSKRVRDCLGMLKLLSHFHIELIFFSFNFVQQFLLLIVYSNIPAK